MAEGTSVGSLYYDLDIDDKNLAKGLDEGDKKVKSFGDRIGKMGDTIQDGMKTAAKGLAVVGAGLTLYAKNATDFTTGLVKSSKSLGVQIGVTTTEASRLVAAFGRMGIEAGDAAQMFGIFSKNIVQSTTNSTQSRLAFDKLNLQIQQTQMSIKSVTADIQAHGDKSGQLSLKLKELNNTLASQKDALKQNSDSFQKLGISTVDAQGKQKDFNTILFEVADKFKDMPNGVDKTAIALDLFGRSGKDMIKVLNLGASGIQDLEKQADKLGLTLNEKTIGAINGLVQSQKDLKEKTDALKIAIGTATAPPLTKFNEGLNKATTAAINAREPIHTIVVDLLAFGGPIAAGLSTALATLANISNITGTVMKALAGIGGFIVIAALIAGAVYLVIQQMGGLHEAIKKVQPLLDQFKKWWGDAKDFALLAVKEIKDHLDDVAAAVKVLITGDFKGGIFGLNEQDPAIQALEHVHNALTDVWNVLKEVGLFIASMFMPIINGLVDVFKLLWPSIEAVFASLWQNLLPALKQLWDAVVRLWNALNPALMDALKIIAVILGALLFAAIWLAINALNIVVQVLSFLISVISNLINWISNLAGWFGTALVAVIKFFRDLPGHIANAVGDIGNLLYNAGKNIIGGLLRGITDKFNDVKSYVGGMGKWISDHKGPITYDKKLLVNHGAAIMSGFNVGLTKGFADTVALVSGMAGSISANVIRPQVNLTPGTSSSGVVNNHAGTTVNIGQINNSQDEAYVIRRLDRNQQLESMGMSPL